MPNAFTSALWNSWQGFLLRLAICFACMLVLFDLIGNFDLRQSIVLAACFSWLAVDSIPGKPEAIRWQPFWIQFNPKFSEMLCAVGLISKAEDWGQCVASRGSGPDPVMDVERHPYFTCTTLVRPSMEVAGVIAWKPWDTFSTNYELELPLLSVAYPDEPNASPYSDTMRSLSCPRFFIKESFEGYSFGLEVKKSWWDHMKVDRPEIADTVISTEERTNFFLPEAVFLTMGIIPFWDLCRYYFQPYQLSSKLRNKQENRRKAELEKNGWKAAPRIYEIKNDPERLVHKFMVISNDYLR